MANNYIRTTATEAGTDGALTRDLSLTAGTGTLVSQNVNDTAFVDCQVWTRTVGAGVYSGVSTTWSGQLSINAISGTVGGRFRFERVNSSGVSQSQSAWSTTWTTTGVKTLSTTWNAGTWAAGDRLVIRCQIQRTGGHGNVSVTFDNTTASFVDAPPSGTPATINASAFTGTTTTPAPTVTAGTGASTTATAVAGTTTFDQPTIVAENSATITATAIFGSASVPGPTSVAHTTSVAEVSL